MSKREKCILEIMDEHDVDHDVAEVMFVLELEC